MKTIYLIISVILMSISGYANQSHLNGFITDDNGQELERAWVVVLNADDLSYVTGTITDENGYFTIEGVEEGEYVISVHHISVDAPKIIGKWNPESPLNGVNKLQIILSDKEMSMNIHQGIKTESYTFKVAG